MKKKPIVCVIDDDPNVRLGWRQSLGQDATLIDFRNHKDFLKASEKDPSLISSLQCVIVGRYFKEIDFDMVSSDIPQLIRNSGSGPVFLNWQGYITKEELSNNFDGKLFHKYGVKWQTLRLRIQKFEKCQKQKKHVTDAYPILTAQSPQKSEKKKSSSRPERCEELLKMMASNAKGSHREKIEYLATQDQQSGIALLEAIYNRLVTDKNTPPTCPSRYINSSPVIAKRMLHDALYG